MTLPDKWMTAERVAAAGKALWSAKLHPAATDSVMMLTTMTKINGNADGDYREQSTPLVITPSRGSNYGHHGNCHANLATCALWPALHRPGKQCL